jgi:Domain of unknown function (DUF5069)
MATPSYSWSTRFNALFSQSVARYRSGDHDFTRYYTPDEQSFLASIGYKPREFFDFVEDHVNYGDPSPETALLVAAVRRDYLKVMQHGQLSTRETTPDQLPPKPAAIDGIPWLPRLMAKARLKLKGEMDPEMMYGCGGDRDFLSKYDIHPADFLRAVWAAGDDDAKIISFVKKQA